MHLLIGNMNVNVLDYENLFSTYVMELVGIYGIGNLLQLE